MFILEGVYSVSGETIVCRRVTKSTRRVIYWLLHSTGLILMTIGLIVTIVNTENRNREHFASADSIFELVTFVVTCVVTFFGILATKARYFYPRVRPVVFKVIHNYGEILMVVLLISMIINGTYTNWIEKVKATETGKSLVLASFVIAAILILIKPIIGAFARTKFLLNPPPQLESATDST